MKKHLILGLFLAIALTGCGDKLNDTTIEDYESYVASIAEESEASEIEVETIEDTDTTEEQEEDSILVKKLKEKFNLATTDVIYSTHDTFLSMNLPDGYTYELMNTINEDNNVELIAIIRSTVEDGLEYYIEVFEVPKESSSFLTDSPLTIDDVTNENAKKLLELVNVDNKEFHTDIRVLDSEGEEHEVIKYDVNTDLSILGIDNVGVCKEPIAYFAIDNSDSYIALMITEKKVSETVESTETTDKSVNATESTEKVEESSRETIIESAPSEEAELAESEHAEEISRIYEELDDDTKKYIEEFTNKFMEKDIESLIEYGEASSSRIESIGETLLDNIMLGKF